MAARRSMNKRGYTPISTFWAVVVPGVILGVCYYTWNSHGYVAMRLRAALRPIVGPITEFFSRVI